jgi:hypothetical protein
MPFMGNFDWDNELGKPVVYRPMYHCDWEQSVEAALDMLLKEYWEWLRNEELPYWGA